MMQTGKKIWIDLDNTPHVPFFKPIADELQKQGYSVVFTARDRFQLCELADMFGMSYTRIGRDYGKNRLLKLMGIMNRTVQLMPIAHRLKPDLAVSHVSRSQLLLAKLLGIPAIVIDDYEHSDMSLHRGCWVIVPESIPDQALHSLGGRILKYPGIKEDVYVPAFKPNSNILGDIGVKENHVVVTVRPPATEAHYHNQESEDLFEAAVNFIGEKQNTTMVILPRNDRQKAEVQRIWPDWCKSAKIIIPYHAVDGLNLIWYSDLVISGGGTMNREAAALGVPVYSTFRGKTGAVDRYLADEGRLVMLENVSDVRSRIVVKARERAERPQPTNRAVLKTIVDGIVSVLNTSSMGREKST